MTSIHLRGRLAAFAALGLLSAACTAGDTAPETSPDAAEPTDAPATGSARETEPPQDAQTLLIGAALPLTGGVAAEGDAQRDGYDMWMDAVNAHGGIQVGDETYLVEIQYYDYQSETTTAVSLTERLITEDGAQFIFGPFGSGATQASAVITERYGIPMMSPSASSEVVYQQGYQHLFGILVPNSVVGNQTLDLVDQVGADAQTMAIIARNDLFPTAVAAAMTAAAEERGIEVVVSEQYPIDAQDLSVPLLAAKAADPDILIGAGYVSDLILLTKQAKELQVSAPIFVQLAGPAYPDYTDALGADANYITTPTWWAPEAEYTGELFGSAMDFYNDFEAEYGYPPDYISAASAVSGVTLQAAIEQAGTVEPAAVRDALAASDIQTFYGNIRFNEQGQNIGTPVTMLQIQEQQLVPVAPEEVATADLIYPMPPWTDR